MNKGTKDQTDQRHILIVDDEPIVRESLAGWFEEDGHSVKAAPDAQSALRLLRDGPWDLAFVDVKMPGMDGLELLRRIRAHSPDTRVIVMTAFATVETAVEALKEGAYDYLVKPFDADHLSHLVRKATELDDLVQENVTLKRQIASAVEPMPIVGTSPSIRHVDELVATVAPTETTVLVTGESGTGKELVARAIHARSPRAFMPLVVVNCGALPEGTLESELFGHERGAFTGAQFRHKGKFELADGGTLFLDEIAEIAPRIQVELLRVLEEKTVIRVGGTKPARANFRLITATNKNLIEAVNEQRFREDLYYRINVYQIHVPPLRERREDIPILAKALLDRLSRSMNTAPPTIEDKAMSILKAYDWPGNVRELANALERALVLQRAQGGPIRATQLPIDGMAGRDVADNSFPSLADVERSHVIRALDQSQWNIAQAARLLGVDRGTVYNKLRVYGLEREHDSRTGESPPSVQSR